MSYSGDYGGRYSAANDMTVGEYVNGWPTVRLTDFLRAFFRQIPFMLIVFIVLLAIGIAVGMTFKREYVASGSLVTKYSAADLSAISTTGGESGLLLQPEQVANTQINIMKSDAVKNRVFLAVGPEIIDPALAAKYNSATGAERQEARTAIFKVMDDAFKAATVPNSFTVNLAYSHEDPQSAVLLLNTFMDEYLAHRRVVTGGESGTLLSDSKTVARERLDDVNAEYKSFLDKNGISSFESDRTSAEQRLAQTRGQLQETQSALVEAESTVATLASKLRTEPREIDIRKDDELQQRIARAEAERQQLLAKYLPNSQPVQQKQQEIDALRRQAASNGGQPSGGRSVGPNPVYQDLQQRLNAAQAQANALRDKEVVLQQQVNALSAQVARYQRITPEYERLIQERQTAQLLYAEVDGRDATASLSESAISSDSVNIVDRPDFARKGPNMRKIIWLLSGVGAAFTAFMLGLLRAFLDPTIYNNSPTARRRRSSDYGREPDYEYGAEPQYQPVYSHDAEPAYQPAAAQAQGPQPVYDTAQPQQASYEQGGQKPYDRDAAMSQTPPSDGYDPRHYQEPDYQRRDEQAYQTTFGTNFAQQQQPQAEANPYASQANSGEGYPAGDGYSDGGYDAPPQPAAQPVYGSSNHTPQTQSSAAAPVIGVVPWAR